MAATIQVDKNWTGEQKRKLQQWLNRYGFTDAGGDNLDEDGVIGPKTNEALEKMNRYQQDMKTPSAETQQLQKQLNDWGYQDASGNSLKEDGVYGPKTDAASNEFENGFIGGLTNGRIQQKTVQKKDFLKMPGNAGVDLQNYIIPKGGPKKVSVADEYNLVDYFKDPVISSLPDANNNVLDNIKKLIERQRKNSVINGSLDTHKNNIVKLSSNNTAESNNLITGAQEWVDENARPILDPFGMHYIKSEVKNDKNDKDFWVADESGKQENFGYNNLYDKLLPLLGFNLETKPVVFTYEGVQYRFQPWYGLYGAGTC